VIKNEKLESMEMGNGAMREGREVVEREEKLLECCGAEIDECIKRDLMNGVLCEGAMHNRE
jgi:hypothetical protein